MSEAANAAALDAVRRGQAALVGDNVHAAGEWFGRAQRLAPSDPTATLGLAVVRLRQRSVEAIDLFAEVSEKHDVREAWTGRATASRIHGRAEKAAEAASRALGRHAFPANNLPNDFGAIAHAVGAPGWCALDSQRRILVHLNQAPSSKVKLTANCGSSHVTLALPKGDQPSLTRLPAAWNLSGKVDVRLGDAALLGSPLDLDAMMRIEGFVDTEGGGLHGWAWHPHDVQRDPVLSVTTLDGSKVITFTAADRDTSVGHPLPLARPRAFRIERARLAHFSGPLRVMGSQGLNLTGSPIDPYAEQLSAETAASLVAFMFPSRPQPLPKFASFARPATPAHLVGGLPTGGAMPRPVDVVVPVYGGFNLTMACLKSVLDTMPDWGRLVVVDDRGPVPALAQEMASMAKAGLLTLITQAANGGFPMAANAGMRHDLERDIVLLNSDTLVPEGWLERLRDAAYSNAAIGSATPVSNDATILSYPNIDGTNPVPTMAEVTALDLMAQRSNSGVTVEIPTSIGFCVYLKRDCLDVTGLFREDLFAQGYCEENDLSMRARHLGWRHVAVPGIFVGHVGGQSFQATKGFLIDRNLRFLNLLHPGYDTLISEYKHADPLAKPRRNFDAARWRGFRMRKDSVLIVTHGRGGGVQTRVAVRARELRRDGLRPIVVWPVASLDGTGQDCVLGDGPEGGTPNLRFSIPRELKELARLLRGDRVVRAEVHHLVGHSHTIFDLFSLLKIPYEMVVHDYAAFCPRINLMRADKRYCAEPDLAGCENCVTDGGTNNDEEIRPTDLVLRSTGEFAAANRIIVPSDDVAKRLRRHFPTIITQTLPWEDDAPNVAPSRHNAVAPQQDETPAEPNVVDVAAPRELVVCVVGAIGIEKGYEYLLACVRDARLRDLPMRFVVVGYTSDDDRLLAAGPVSITGRYDESDAVSLIEAQSADIGFLPSLWPETWCYALSHMWEAGLDVTAFDIGAPAERMRKTRRGRLLPLGLDPAAMNTLILNPAIMLHQASSDTSHNRKLQLVTSGKLQ